MIKYYRIFQMILIFYLDLIKLYKYLLKKTKTILNKLLEFFNETI